MWFMILGVLLLAAKALDVHPVGDWPWWQVLLPFGLAAVWWAFADATGLTQRRAMDRLDERTRERRAKAVRALGLDPDGRRRRRDGSGPRKPPSA